jgi:hypothetical protein
MSSETTQLQGLRSSTKRKRQVVTPGSEWTEKELDFFKIKIKPEDNFETFFGNSPSLNFSDEVTEFMEMDLARADILETIDWDSIKHKQVSRLIKNIISVTKTHKNMESSVDEFAKILFEIFDYDEKDLTICMREEIQLEMCGSKTSAKPDLCIETSSLTIKLLVQEDKSYQVSSSKALANTNPEAQVIAEAIGAFQENNKIRKKFGKPDKRSQLIPCITMLGTYPTFYLFTVTNELANSVKNGEEPENSTIIKQYKIPMRSLSFSDAILINTYKIQILQCYAALKKFVTITDK